jgi:transcriptional regulator GlxA family with amidase domain
MSRTVEESNRRLLRARDEMDRTYAEPLVVPALGRIAHVSEADFIRSFRATFGETPHVTAPNLFAVFQQGSDNPH